MSIISFKILFYLKRQSAQNRKAPIMSRIMINGTISLFVNTCAVWKLPIHSIS